MQVLVPVVYRMLTKFLMMMVAAVAMVAVSMSTSSCSNDGETVDTFVLTSEIVQGTLPANVYNTLVSSIPAVQNVGTMTKDQAVEKFDKAIESNDEAMKDAIAGFKEAGVKDFSITFRLVGSELGEVAKKTWK